MIMRYYNKAQQLKKQTTFSVIRRGAGLPLPKYHLVYLHRLYSECCIKYCVSNRFVPFHGRGEPLPYERIITIFLQDEGTDKMTDYTKRKPTRLKNYDYNSTGTYFITVCTQNRINYFSDIIISNASEPATVRLTRFGKIAEEQIKAINFKYVDVDIENYVIMPNHIHMIVSTFYDNEKDNNVSVTDVVRIFKSLTTRLCKVGPVIFQRSFYDHIIRNDTDYSRILNYINNNPSRWEEDSLYNSAKTVTVL